MEAQGLLLVLVGEWREDGVGVELGFVGLLLLVLLLILMMILIFTLLLLLLLLHLCCVFLDLSRRCSCGAVPAPGHLGDGALGAAGGRRDDDDDGGGAGGRGGGGHLRLVSFSRGGGRGGGGASCSGRGLRGRCCPAALARLAVARCADAQAQTARALPARNDLRQIVHVAALQTRIAILQEKKERKNNNNKEKKKRREEREQKRNDVSIGAKGEEKVDARFLVRCRSERPRWSFIIDVVAVVCACEFEWCFVQLTFFLHLLLRTPFSALLVQKNKN